jgi:hypothetical protein
MALVASVLGTSATQQQLVPALMRVYGAADFVVGLDVDKDDYDKFSVSCLLLCSWFRDRVQGQGSRTGFRDRVQGQGSGTGFRDRVQGQGSGTGFRDRVQG